VLQLSSFADCVRVVDTTQEHSLILIETEWSVALPNKFVAKGVSDTQVKALESVYWYFPEDYPLSPASPRLRHDFPTHLPHINPYKVGDPVFPCISAMSLAELLHNQGFQAVLLAMSQWLNHAAANELHCPVQGWEPMRRDDTKGLVVVDSNALRSIAAESKSTVCFYRYRYLPYNRSHDFVFGNILTPGLGSDNRSVKRDHIYVHKHTQIANSCAIQLSTNRAVAIDEYRADTVSDYNDLLSLANFLHLQHALAARVSNVLSMASPSAMQKRELAQIHHILVVFCIKRPFHLVGTENSWELLAYRIDISHCVNDTLPVDSSVSSVALMDRCSPTLLQAVSGEHETTARPITIFGCGSLGSKLTLHLAKSGCYEFSLYDKELFSSHNNARHGLTAESIKQISSSKSELLSDALDQLGVSTKATKTDIVKIPGDEQSKIDINSNFIIDTTASQPVTYFLSHHANFKSAKLVQSAMYGAASMGVLAFEGASRCVRVDDVAAYLDTLCLKDEKIQRAMYGGIGPDVNHFGEGCGSLTTIINDIDISILASSLSAIFHKHIQTNNDAESATVHIGHLDKETMNQSWTRHDLIPTVVLSADKDDWQVRILGHIANRIKTKSQSEPKLETGGWLAGYACQLSKTIYVTEEFESPQPPYQSSTRFELPAEGVQELFESVHAKTNGQITFLGTWHSHTGPTSPSALDKKTLANLQLGYDLPIVMLVQIQDNLVKVEC